MDHPDIHFRRFRDRHQAGTLLAQRLLHYRDTANVLVLALPRGGVPVASEVARAIGAELDVLLVRKLGCPGHSELAMGAIASGGARIVDAGTVAALRITEEDIAEVEHREHAELHRREQAYRGGRPAPDVAARIVILVDDGLATGSSMKAAIAALRQRGAGHVVVAVPVAPANARAEFSRLADDFVCILEPLAFHAVGLWYERFDQVSDSEVQQLLLDSTRTQTGSGNRE